jgi:hypothetical protein
MDTSGKTIRRFKSQKEAVSFLGVSSNAHISACCHGKEKTAHGYKWAFEIYDKKEVMPNEARIERAAPEHSDCKV